MALTLDPISVANRQQHPNSISTTTFLRQLNPFSRSSGKKLSHFSSNEIFDLQIHVSFFASPCSASYARKSADYNSFEIFRVFFKYLIFKKKYPKSSLLDPFRFHVHVEIMGGEILVDPKNAPRSGLFNQQFG
jgi:hypothetical protein